jgi:hypothetical protein
VRRDSRCTAALGVSVGAWMLRRQPRQHEAGHDEIPKGFDRVKILHWVNFEMQLNGLHK